MKSVKALTSVLFMAILAIAISAFTGIDPVVPFSALAAFSLLMSFVPMPKGIAMMAITKEIWTKDVVGNLFKDNGFAKRAFNADEYVLAGKVVHIPVAGTASAVNKNVTSFPVSAVKRTDTDATYNLDTFYSTPRQIEQIEKYELSYDKRQDALGEDQAALIEAAMEALLYNWGPAAAKTTLTTGGSRTATLTGATGNRKKFDKAEFSTIKLLMDAASVPANGRVALLTAYHYNDFLASLTDAERTDIGRVADLKTGLIGKYLGFDIYMRSTVLRYRGADGSQAKVDEQASGFAASTKTDDRAASLFWHDKHVERALGEVDIFENNRQAEYYGDIYSMILRMGGRIRKDEGVYAAVEALV